MSLALTNRLRERAALLAAARAFFAEKNVMEVDVPILSRHTSVDAHIDLIEATCLGKKAFLHSSPEYGMKRLLADGSGDIYQISHVFRNDERGERHNPEFTMVEWYRCGFTLQEMIAETVAFVQLFLPDAVSFETLTYRQAFDHYVGHFPDDLEERDRLFAFEIEPHLQNTILYGFPSEQAALAQLDEEGMAERFELFYQGVELANGYHELTDPVEQEKRLEEANAARIKMGKLCYPVDQRFLEALKSGIPDCCGVAVGFDRLMMLRGEAHSLADVLSIAWEEA
ncbi:MAG: Elongation factor P--(R)-beta-lysine ligase [Chlamydiales bacterium]|nr:Elongation factor P--(R)-beta-lysine ligase [Chlamydiales bacterium]